MGVFVAKALGDVARARGIARGVRCGTTEPGIEARRVRAEGRAATSLATNLPRGKS